MRELAGTTIHLRLLLVTLPVLFGLAATTSYSQLADSRGRDFWFVFPPNFHTDEESISRDTVLQREHRLYIYITADTPTSGEIQIRKRDGTLLLTPFSILDTTSVYTHSVFFADVEMQGYNRGGSIKLRANQCETPALNSVHIVADNDIAVYALSQAFLTSEAFAVLPTDVLGTEYVVMAYTADVIVSRNGVDESSTPSQFVVVATEDSSEVVIEPSCPTVKNLNRTQIRVTLNRGESYLVQSDPLTDKDYDLTGSVVRSSKPIAILAGHQRTSLPRKIPILGSRDCLIEMLTPVKSWGKTSIVTPFVTTKEDRQYGHDIVRVLAAFDSTEIFVNGAYQTTIHRGNFIELPLIKASEIHTSQPSLVAQYRKTTATDIDGEETVGDPFMMLVPASEQFMSSYRFMSAQAPHYSQGGDSMKLVYTQQWLNVVCKTSDVQLLLLDDEPIDVSKFSMIEDTEYSFGVVRLTDGVHELRSDSSFGIYVYGYGYANSYGYIGGMAYRETDKHAPDVNAMISCGTASGIVTDSLLGDSRLHSVAVVDKESINASVTFDEAIEGLRVAWYSIVLTNPYLDGRVVLRVQDRIGNSTTDTINIPGFTVGTDSMLDSVAPLRLSRKVPINHQRCEAFDLVNYGGYPQHIKRIYSSDGKPLEVSKQTPVILSSGDSIHVRVCRTAEDESFSEDTLFVADSCTHRAFAVIGTTSLADRNPPTIERRNDSCNGSVMLTVREDSEGDIGVEGITVIADSTRNCTVRILDYPSTVVVHHEDPFYDAFYAIIVRDSAGNESMSIDTLPGFTLEIGNRRGAYRVSTLDDVAIGNLHCAEIPLNNYGHRAIVINNVRVANNTNFSIPLSQLPITIPAFASSAITVCFQPVLVREEYENDSLVFEYGCTESVLEVRSYAREQNRSGLSRCKVELDSKAYALSSNSIGIMPVPAGDELTIVLSHATPQMDVLIYSLEGKMLVQNDYVGEPGDAFLVNVSSLESGAYVCLVKSGTHQYRRIVHIKR